MASWGQSRIVGAQNQLIKTVIGSRLVAMEDVVVDTAGGQNNHAMVSRMLSLMAPDSLLPRFQGFEPFLPGARPGGLPTDGDGPPSLLENLGSLDEANWPKGRKDAVEKKPFLTKDDVLRIRDTVDACYERDVKNLTAKRPMTSSPSTYNLRHQGLRPHRATHRDAEGLANRPPPPGQTRGGNRSNRKFGLQTVLVIV